MGGVSIREIVEAVHCLCSIGEQIDKMTKEQEDFKEWIREIIDQFDDRLIRLEIIEETVNKIPVKV